MYQGAIELEITGLPSNFPFRHFIQRHFIHFPSVRVFSSRGVCAGYLIFVLRRIQRCGTAWRQPSVDSSESACRRWLHTATHQGANDWEHQQYCWLLHNISDFVITSWSGTILVWNIMILVFIGIDWISEIITIDQDLVPPIYEVWTATPRDYLVFTL